MDKTKKCNKTKTACADTEKHKKLQAAVSGGSLSKILWGTWQYSCMTEKVLLNIQQFMELMFLLIIANAYS